MTTTTAKAAPSPIAVIFGNLLSTVKSEFLADLKAPLLASATALDNNPTELELAAQGIALQGALIGQLPVGETQGIKAGAGTLIQLINLIPNS